MAPPPPPPSSSPLSSCSSSSNSPYLLFHRSNHFTPLTIEEGDEQLEDIAERRRLGLVSTPIYRHSQSTTPTTTIGAIVGARRSQKDRSESVAVSCTKCRPTSRNKTNAHVVPSPNRMFKSVLYGLAKLSPKPSSATSSPAPGDKERNRWMIAAEELSRKLAEATRKRDEAILEASELKYAMAELEKKLNRLEIYCHNLSSGFEIYNTGGGGDVSGHGSSPFKHQPIAGHDRIIDEFLVAVAESRTAVRSLSRALTVQIRQIGIKVFDRISSIIQPYDIKISLSRNPRTFIVYLEAVLNSSLFEHFESTGFTEGSVNRILNPLDRSEAQYAAFSALQGLTWEEVLSKGTKHFSEDFSRFCDRKMGEIVGLLGLNRAWPESLLQAFFRASKSVWLVHLLANSVHPGLAIFRVENGSRFDPVYMEDTGEDRVARVLVPTDVRIMVAPGFYVFNSVIKCKVFCRYYNGGNANAVANYERA